MLISRYAKSLGIKVLIGGTGGDDVFSGYRRHQALLLNNSLEFIPKPFLKILSKFIKHIPSSNNSMRRLKKISRDWGQNKTNQILGFFNWLPSNQFFLKIISDQLLSKIQNYEPYSYGENLLSQNAEVSDLDQVLILEQNTFLIDHNLNYTDKLSMSEGVEVRVPYLDKDLIKLAGHIPQKFKIRNHVPKYILKKVAEKYLPKDIIYRSKTGFGAPVNELIKNNFSAMITEVLNNDTINKDGIFNGQTIEKIILENKNGTADYNYNILSLLAIQSWLNQFPWKILK